MKLVKIIVVAAIATNLAVQVAHAGSLLTGTSGSTGSSLLGNSNTTGSSLLNSYEETYTNTNNIYDSSGYQMDCRTDLYGNTICE